MPDSVHTPKGWSIPLGRGSTDRLDSDAGPGMRDVAELVLGVVPGERPFLPEFGCRIHLLESVSTDEERAVAAALVEEALERWLPRLGVDRVEVARSTKTSCLVRLRCLGAWHELDLTLRRPAPGGASAANERPPARREEGD